MATPIARLLMTLATAAPPPGRADWAGAMRAEYETLQRGRLGWALGCLATMTGWRLRAEAFWLLAMIAAVVFLETMSSQILFAMPRDLIRPIFYAYGLGVPALICAAIAAWRPDRSIATALILPLVQFGYGTAVLVFLLQAHLTRKSWVIMDAKPEVGVGAMVGYCLLGALIGGAIGRAARARRQAA